MLLLLTCLSLPLLADEDPPEIVGPEEQSSIDATNQYIARQWDSINRTVDTFFTNKQSPTENKSSVFVYTSIYKKEGQKPDNQYDFQLRFDLPNTTKNLKIIIEREQDEISDALSDKSISSTKTITKNGTVVRTRDNSKQNYSAGANFLLSKSQYFVSFLSFGIRLDMPLNPSVKLDLEKELETKFMKVLFSQKFNYYRQEGLQNISQATMSKRLDEKFQLDLVNSLVWSDETDILVFRHNFILYQELDLEKGLSYSIGANARFSPTYYYESYDASVSYRQLLYSHWLYGSVTLGADFPKEEHFDDNKFVQVRLDMFFKEK